MATGGSSGSRASRGQFLFLDLLGIFVWPAFWGRDTEDRIVEQELHRRGYPPQDGQ